jgi:hypothetical protein
MNVVCIKHRLYRGKDFPVINCRACAAIWALYGSPRVPFKGAVAK